MRGLSLFSLFFVGACVIVATIGLASAAACPDCAVGREARVEVVERQLGFNLFVFALPFLIIGLIGWRAESIGRMPLANQDRARKEPHS